MPTLDVFTCPVVYKYKTRLFSLGAFVVLLLTAIAFIFPLIIAYQAGGFWLKNRIYVENPSVYFAYKYFLIGEKDFPEDPIICSTFSSYKNNPINDDCTIVKVQEIDENKDRRKDFLKFEAHFLSQQPIRTLRLLLFFHVDMKDFIDATIETVTTFDYAPNDHVQKIEFFGDLKLQQKSVLQIDNFPEVYNYSIEFGEKSIADLLAENARNKLSARLTNTHVTQRNGFSSAKPITVSGQIFYSHKLIHYQPGFWEEVKWAWMQYLSVFILLSYIGRTILKFLFSTRRLKSYIIAPWKVK